MLKDIAINAKLYSIRRHPSIIVEFVKAHKWKEIENNCARLDERESLEVILYLKKASAYQVNQEEESKLNRLCYVEDWQKREIRDTLSELQKLSSDGFIHSKDWEWALGIIAMSRFGKLNDKSTEIGIGSGNEPIPFYLANKINHVYATDIYRGNDGWKRAAPPDFVENPKKYAPFPYREDALTVLRMDGTNLKFPSETFDITFSFSSIEHFGEKNHSGALRSLQEIERVLKPGGLAVITTEYIINDKEHPEFFNRRTIYSDLIDKLEKLQLVEPLDLRITTKTLDTTLDFFYIDANWDNLDYEFKKKHPLILLRVRNVLFTSLMLVFQKS